MKLNALTDAIQIKAEALRFTCGIARSYMMAAMATDLAEITHTLNQCADEEELQQLINDIDLAITTATTDHALLTSNRKPSRDIDTISPMHPSFFFTELQHATASATEAEQQLYQQLLINLNLPPLDCRHAFPLCELVVHLGSIFNAAAQQQRNLFKARKCQELQAKADNENLELKQLIGRTIETGLMTPDGNWAAGVTRNQIAYWVDKAARRLKIPFHWKWASQRWGLPNLAVDQHNNLTVRPCAQQFLIDQIFEG